MRAVIAIVILALTSVAAAQKKPKGKKPTAAEAKAFVTKVNEDLKDLAVRYSTAEWIRNTYITDDTERNSAYFNEQLLGFTAQAIKDAARFNGVKSDFDTERMLYLLRVSSPLSAPSDPKKRLELATIAAELDGIYGKGKWCGKDGKAKCKNLLELSETMAKSRDAAALLDAWVGWHSISREMRPLYARFAELGNEGAREIGFADLGEQWRSAYEMKPDEMRAEVDRLWKQVEPLYRELHCKVRRDLATTYGAAKVPAGKPIPAHLTGNMWAQDWSNIYALVEPYKNHASMNVDEALVAQKYDDVKMTKLAEGFFTSLGMNALPKTFWERSMLRKPADREVVCHASAWDVTYSNDLRIKMCIKPNEEDLNTIHHELGHVYYYNNYYKQPFLYQNGAHDGFHEAIGDALVLSITPGYLQKIGLLKSIPSDDKGVINFQMKKALEGVAFLPFGYLMDRWRWDVFAGKTKQGDYNKAWWELRRSIQGVDAPVARSEEDFDPGAKYHIPGNTPYLRYFLARILQYQFHQGLCRAGGFKGPLHECSIYGSKAAGEKLQALLALGASRPWPEALEAITGSRTMDATPLLEYYAPLQRWLKEQNAGQQCGW